MSRLSSDEIAGSWSRSPDAMPLVINCGSTLATARWRRAMWLPRASRILRTRHGSLRCWPTAVRCSRRWIAYSDHQIGRGPEFYARACELSLEGIVSKPMIAPYAPGNRGLWVKVQAQPPQRSNIAGYWQPTNGRCRRSAAHSPCIRKSPFATRQVVLRPLRRWDTRAAAAHGFAPQDVKARGDNDRGTD